MPRANIYSSEKLVVPKWVLSAGERIPLHDHRTNPTSEHITIIAKGQVEIICPDAGVTISAQQGDLIDFTEEQQKHEVVAITDAIVFHVVKE